MTHATATTSSGSLALGLDTGGTYTDAVVLDGRNVVATAKALTTKHDLSIGLAEAIKVVIGKLPSCHLPGDIGLVSVSTTLATNAIVESQRVPICVILIGFDQKMLARSGLQQALGNGSVVLVAGGHMANGEESTALDCDAAKAAILEHAARVDAFAVSSLFSVRNPSHELHIRELVRELTNKPVTCGHQLTSGLDAPRRALTAALNAQLTPQIRHLIEAVQSVLSAIGINAPLMVVKGDGSLMAAKVALECPVETILSGPAASVVGAKFLTGLSDFIVSDMGGTTTDIAIVNQGKPVLNANGALVGGWNTMVHAVDVRTHGLGGDSEVALDDLGNMSIGPRRVVPLSLFAKTWPAVLEQLRDQLAMDVPPLHPGRFACRQAFRTGMQAHTRMEQKIWEALASGPKALAEIARTATLMRALQSLVRHGLVSVSGMTPSDAMHVLGKQSDWNTEAARLGTILLLREGRNWLLPVDETNILELCARIREQVVRKTGRVLCAAAFSHDPGIRFNASTDCGPFGDTLIDSTVGGTPFSQLMNVAVRLNVPLVAIGAPVGSYYPQLAQRLDAKLIIPEHAAVTNAIGAVAGVVMQSVEILVTQTTLSVFRVHAPGGQQDFDDAQAAIAHAREVSRQLAYEAAQRAGAAMPEIETTVRKKSAEQAGGEEFMAEAAVCSTATGRPAVADARAGIV